MLRRSALLIQLLALVCFCRAEEATTATTKEPAREGTSLEIAIVLAGILAATTISVVIVLAPTVIYFNYRMKQETEGAPVMVH